MKSTLPLLVSTLISFSTVAQNIEGIYSNKWESPSGEVLEYRLDLKPDGSFIFNSERTFLDSHPELISEAEGTWNLENHMLVLNTDQTSEDELTSNLNNSKARYISVSPRNPNFNLVKPSFKFYKSDVFYAKDMELHKTESSISSAD